MKCSIFVNSMNDLSDTRPVLQRICECYQTTEVAKNVMNQIDNQTHNPDKSHSVEVGDMSHLCLIYSVYSTMPNLSFN